MGVLVGFALSGLSGRVAAADSAPAPAPAPFVEGKLALAPSDVVAFLGGADVAAAQHSGHLEALLTIHAHARGRSVRFRNFGWEGDTVFSQPREIGFPSIETQLVTSRVTVVFLQFGRMESLDGSARVAEFTRAYAALLGRCLQRTPRVVLIAPPPFEKAPGPLPDLSSRNADLAAYVNGVRELAHKQRLPFADAFSSLRRDRDAYGRLTDNGLQLSSRGQALLAAACARELGLGDVLAQAGTIDEHGAWSNPAFERLRQAVIGKNRLWFDYSRPQNWAFLGGDRTTQPSSRDHRDPKLRWFPKEMEQFLPLIEAKEAEIQALTEGLSR